MSDELFEGGDVKVEIVDEAIETEAEVVDQAEPMAMQVAGEPIPPAAQNGAPPSIERMMELAITHGGEQMLEVLERLTALKNAQEDREAEKAFFKSLTQYQATYPEIKKGKAVMNKPKGNEAPTVRYRYAPLDVIINTVRDCLKANGFSFIIKPVEDKPESVTARVILHHEDGHSEESEFTAPIDSEAYMTAPQKVAGARSFAKRQAFCDVTGTVPSGEDDDATSLTTDEEENLSAAVKEIERTETTDRLRELFTLHYKAAKTDRARTLIMDAKDQQKAVLKEIEDAATDA